jgi:Ca-activated chloride channel homolog
MSFEQPLYLVGLALLPLLAIAYVAHERHRQRGQEAFATASLLVSVAPRRPGWRRHAPLLLYGLALAALLVALGRPQATVAVPVERASIMLATDHSGSMQATDVAPSRLVAAHSAADRFLAEVPDQIGVGVVAFNHAPKTLLTPTTDRRAARAAITSLRPSGGTATGEALEASLQALGAGARGRHGRRPGAIVLLSDGAATHGRDPEGVARRARRLRIPIYTVALGTDAGTIQVTTPSGQIRTRRVPPDRPALRRIAAISRGEAYAARDADALSAVYERLGSRIATRDEPREITAAFAGAGLAMVVAGGALSLRWFRRLP